MRATAAVWVVWLVAAVVSGQEREHGYSSVQSQQNERLGVPEDEPGLDTSTTRTVRILTYQPNQPDQLPGEQQQWDRNRATPGHEDRDNLHTGSATSRRGGGGGGGGGSGGGGGGGGGGGTSRQRGGSSRRHGRRQQSGRGLRQGGGGGGGGNERQSGRGRRLQESGDSISSGIILPDDSIDNSSVSEDTSSTSTSPLEVDTSQQHTNAIILMLQRLGERLSGIEVLQRQQTERIGTINYRLTKLELQAEERKSFTNDLSNAVRHRMERTDAELDQVNTQLEGIKSSIMNLGQQYVDIKTTLREIPTQDNRGNEVNGLKMQAMMGTLQGLRTTTNEVVENIDQLSNNLTSLNKIASNLTSLSEKMVTKKYLLENLTELKSQDSTMSLLARVIQSQPSTNRRGSRKGEPEDCWQLLRKGRKESGVYSIQPRYSLTPFFVYCDMETDGGGWTVIQRREDGSVDFLREWADYKYGFGNVAGEYWLGNEKIHLLTNQQVSTLRVDVADFDQQVGHALYSAFAIGSELEGYALKMLGNYSGDAGDSLRYHVGRRFSTIDVDNDAWPERSCARDHMGAWWYRACETSNLNGRYLHGPIPPEHQYTGLYWYDFRGPQYSLWRSRMMIRRGGKVDHPVFKNFTEIQSQAGSSREEEATTARTFDPNQDPYVTFDYFGN